MRRAVVHGQQVYLRPLEDADLPRLLDWVNDPEITQFTSYFRPMMEKHERDFLERIAASTTDMIFGIAQVADDVLIGTAGLHRLEWRSRNAGFGIEIGEKQEWGKGKGREATTLTLRYGFETLNLHRIWLEVYDYNARGLKAYEATGFKREGVQREHQYRHGRYWDMITMGILRPEWDAMQTGGAAPPAPQR